MAAFDQPNLPATVATSEQLVTPKLDSTVSTPWLAAPAVFTQQFGQTGLAIEPNGFHSGYDLAAPAGTSVLNGSGKTAKVTWAGWLGDYGNAVELQLADGSTALLGHLKSIDVSKGQVVTPGQLLGTEGQTGNATGLHLHFEIRTPGKGSVDPLGWLYGIKGALGQVVGKAVAGGTTVSSSSSSSNATPCARPIQIANLPVIGPVNVCADNLVAFFADLLAGLLGLVLIVIGLVWLFRRPLKQAAATAATAAVVA